MPRRSSAPPAAALTARVFGAGPTGALAALALARSGWQVQLVDPQPRQALLQRSRAYALTHSSAALLRDLDLWDSLAQARAPFRRLELCDRSIGRQVTFEASDLPAAAQRNDPDAVALELAADGHGSPRRTAARIRHWRRPYRQGCLTVQVGLRGSAADQAWELFRAEGPFAVLPLGGEAFQLVWSAPLPQLRRLEQLEPALFLDALNAALPDALQAEVLLDQPAAFPVALELAWPLQRGRLLLLGEAAHRSHPVGGQGLNLCWRDVATLQRLAAQVTSGRLPLSRLPRRYAERRWLDIALVLLATDALVRLFSNRQPLLLPLRQLSLALLARFPWLRRLSLSAMTDGPCRLRWH